MIRGGGACVYVEAAGWRPGQHLTRHGGAAWGHLLCGGIANSFLLSNLFHSFLREFLISTVFIR